jgi:hypothetical protein
MCDFISWDLFLDKTDLLSIIYLGDYTLFLPTWATVHWAAVNWGTIPTL